MVRLALQTVATSSHHPNVTKQTLQGVSDIYFEKVQSLTPTLTQAKGYYHNILSVLATVALVKTLSCARFKKAVAQKSQPPKGLVQALSQAMKFAKKKSLTVPGTLQVTVLKYTGQIVDNDEDVS